MTWFRFEVHGRVMASDVDEAAEMVTGAVCEWERLRVLRVDVSDLDLSEILTEGVSKNE